MSSFKKRFAQISNLRKVAEEVGGEDADRQAFLDACASIGYTVVPDVLENGKPIITPYVLMANNQAFLSQVSGAGDKESSVQIVNDEIQKLEDTLQPWKSKFYGSLSSAAYNKLQMKMRAANGGGQPRMSAQEQIAKIILDGALSLEGNKVISAELEEVAKTLVAEFETRVRELLSSLEK